MSVFFLGLIGAAQQGTKLQTGARTFSAVSLIWSHVYCPSDERKSNNHTFLHRMNHMVTPEKQHWTPARPLSVHYLLTWSAFLMQGRKWVWDPGHEDMNNSLSHLVLWLFLKVYIYEKARHLSQTADVFNNIAIRHYDTRFRPNQWRVRVQSAVQGE